VVVGGYGQVGQTVSKLLAERLPGKVYAAGRNLSKAEQFSSATDGAVKPMLLDVSLPFSPEGMDCVKTVVMCLDQENTDFARQCLQHGIHYMDVSAKTGFMVAMEELHEEAAAAGATAVLSVGLVPGMSNLLAADAAAGMDQVDSVDIALMLGMGEAHGRAAIEWTVENMAQDFWTGAGTQKQQVSSFTSGKTFDFGEGIGRKMAYRFNFSDQHTLAGTLGVSPVTTRLCFDSAFVTGLLFVMKKAGVLKLLRFKPMARLAAGLFARMRLGTEAYALKVEASGIRMGAPHKAERFFHGIVESDMTARVAAAVAAELCRDEQPSGVFHIEQLFDTSVLGGEINGRIGRRG
jgi:saccharopine dehydrogenase-like NADP-dependent oxidoreductase